jgi:hypothetical protein
LPLPESPGSSAKPSAALSMRPCARAPACRWWHWCRWPGRCRRRSWW